MDCFVSRNFCYSGKPKRSRNMPMQGVSLIGDLPFFVSPDSSDAWANPEFFLLDERCRPRFVAGVPPDYFSTQGQLWGNPVYNWDALRSTGYRWWIDRIRTLLGHVDVIRLDHFRAFAAAWHVPAGAKTAQTGEWVRGPGASFFKPSRENWGVCRLSPRIWGSSPRKSHFARSIPSSRNESFPVRVRWPRRKSVSSAQFCQQHGRLYGHA